MAEKHEDEISLNVTNYVKGIKDMNEVLKVHNKLVNSIKASLNEQVKGFGQLVVKYKEITSTGQKVNATLVRTRDGFKVLRAAVVEIEGEYSKYIRTVKESMRLQKEEIAVSRFLAKIRKDAAKADPDLQAEAERRKKVLADQERQYARLKEDNKRLIQYDKERRLQLEGQLKVTKALADARAKAAQQQRDENKSGRQFQAGQVLGTKLQRQFIDPFKGLASPQQLTRIQSHINKVVQAVERGAIKASQAQRIIQNVSAGNPQVLTGVAARIQTTASSIVAANQKMTKSFADVIRGALKLDGALKGIDFARLLGIQLLHTAIRNFLGALSQSIDTAKQFSIRIAEIQTISHDTQLSFTEWATNVRRLSDEFGNPILDVAEGTYEAISNQVAKGADATAFMAKALELARVTVASTADAVNALSSVINAYGKSTADAEQISAVLFKTVDLGRIRLSDMANTLGRISPLAATLGISFEELQAAIATLTVVGISPDETLTALNAVMTKLLNPTKEMSRFLASIGAASGPAAIATKGFEGVLRELIATSEAGNFALDDLFNEIRATRGILPLKRAIEGYGKTLDAITSGSMEDFRKAQDEIANNLGSRFEKEINRVKNVFTQDFGTKIIADVLAIGATFDENGKRVSGFAEEMLDLISILKVALSVYAAYKAVTIGLNAALAVTNQIISIQIARATTLNQVLAVSKGSAVAAAGAFRLLGSPLGIGALLLTATAVFAYFENLKREQQELEEQFKNVNANAALKAEELTKKLQEESSKRRETFRKGLIKQFNDFGQYINSLNLLSQKLGKDQAKIIDANAKAIKNSFEIYTKNVQDFIGDTEKSLNTALKNIESAQQRIQQIKDDMSANRFAAQLKLQLPIQQVNTIKAEIDRLTQLGTQIFTGRESAKELDAEADRRRKVFERIAALRVQLAEIVRKAEEEGLEAKEKALELQERQQAGQGIDAAEDNLQNLTRQQQLERAAEAGAKKGSTQAQRDRAANQQARLQATGAAKDQLELAQETEKARRGTESLETLNKQVAASEALLAAAGTKAAFEQQGLQLQQQELQIEQALEQLNNRRAAQEQAKLDQQKQQFEVLKDVFAEVEKFELPDAINPSNIAEIQQQIQDTFNKGINATQDVGIVQQLIQQRERLIAESNRRIQDQERKTQADSLIKRRDDLIKQQQDISGAIDKQVTERTLDLTKLDELLKTANIKDPSGKGLLNVARENLKSGDPKRIQAARDQFDFMLDNVTKARGGFDELSKKVVVQADAFGEGKKTMEDVFFEIRKTLSDISLRPDQAAQLQGQTQGLAKNLNDVNQALANLQPVQTATSSLQDLAKATADLTARFNSFNFGKPLQPAQGTWSSAWARGTDRIPAMLSKGEFVVRESQAKKYWSQLMMINSGTAPLYRAQGGPVEQVSGFSSFDSFQGGGDRIDVGGINVTLTSTGNATTDAKALAFEINRLARRGEIPRFGKR